QFSTETLGSVKIANVPDVKKIESAIRERDLLTMRAPSCYLALQCIAAENFFDAQFQVLNPRARDAALNAVCSWAAIFQSHPKVRIARRLRYRVSLLQFPRRNSPAARRLPCRHLPQMPQ